MRAVSNALWVFLVVLVVGCAQGPASSSSLQNPNAPSNSTVTVSGSIGTEGGGNKYTMIRVFWHEWEQLAKCIEKHIPNEKDLAFRVELEIFALNLREVFQREEEVNIGKFEEILSLDEKHRNEVSRGTIQLGQDYFQHDTYGKNVFLIHFANRYGKTRLEWHSYNVGRAAYICAPGTVL